MKKAETNTTQPDDSDDLRPEYHFDYSKSRPNRFAGKGQGERRVVILEPDVAAVFLTSEEVNHALRELIRSAPPKP